MSPHKLVDELAETIIEETEKKNMLKPGFGQSCQYLLWIPSNRLFVVI